MNIRSEQIQEHLKHQLVPVYLIAGDEPFQVMEVAEAIRQRAVQSGFSEREVWVVDAQFDWVQLMDAAGAMSLFAQKKILDVRVATCKLGQSGTKALLHYLEYLPQDNVLILQMGRLDKTCKSTAWFKKIEQVGGVVQVWDLSPAQTVSWVGQRLRKAGLQANEEAVRYLAERIEGNLLAAIQEINKLVLLYGNKPIGVQHIQAVVADNSRFTTFDLSDAVFAQDARRVTHILHVLQEEDTASTLVLWALNDALRQLYVGCKNLQLNQSNQALLMKMPKTRQAHFQRALKRMENADWGHLFNEAARIELQSKGVGHDLAKSSQRLWDGLLGFALTLVGVKLPF